jgi:hypothetical protein
MWTSADPDGWYPTSVLAPAEDWFPNPVVLEWDTINSAFNADGLYTIQLEVADGSKNLLATSAPVGFVIDNSAPQVTTLEASWSFNSDMSGAQTLPINDCVVIDRGAVPQNVYIQLTYSVTASHLRSVQVSSGGCAGGATLTSALSTVQHWYEDSSDNTVSNVATYTILASQPPGVYGFDVYADTRAFNPAGGDAGPLDDWNYSPPDYYYNWTDPSFAFAIVNA